MKLRRRVRQASPPTSIDLRREVDRLRAALLMENDLFQGLDSAVMGRIAARLPMVTCRAGTVVYSPGETGEGLFILKAGTVRLYRITPDGHKLVLATLRPGTAFGEMGFLGQSMTGSFAEANEDSTICIVSRRDIEEIMMDNPTVAVRMIRLLSTRLREAEDKLEQMAFAPVAERVARLLLHMAEGDEVSGLSHQEMAEMLGAARETVSRELVALKTAGIITIDRRAIRILNSEALAAHAGNAC